MAGTRKMGNLVNKWDGYNAYAVYLNIIFSSTRVFVFTIISRKLWWFEDIDIS